MTTARQEFLRDFTDTNSSNQKNLLLAIKRVLKQDHDILFLPFMDKLTFTKQMGSFFAQKIKAIYLKLDDLSSTLPDILLISSTAESWSGTWMDQFKQLMKINVKYADSLEAWKHDLCTGPNSSVFGNWIYQSTSSHSHENYKFVP